ncbi:unnamed protein product [Albugo candida]|nr:unnamed protein product [Albugo candida]|eukprot:CCI50670.1 unnamed protein product [Albugo candida]
MNDEAAQTNKQQAEAYCLQQKANPNTNWQYALRLFQLSRYEHVKFYTLQVIQELITQGLSDDIAIQIRSVILLFIKQNAQYVEQSATYLKNKIAVVWTLLIKRDYPERWPNAFCDWMELLPLGDCMVEMYFRILIAIYEEVVDVDTSKASKATAHNMKIKDAMREGSCIAEAFDVFYKVLTSSDESERGHQLSVAALETLKCFIGWVDIKLIVNDRYIPLLFQIIRERSHLRCLAINCIFEIIDKGMDHEKKLALLRHLNICEILQALPIHEDDTFAEEVAEVVNAIGLELAECINAFRTRDECKESFLASNALFCQILPLVWQLFSSENQQVSEEVFELVNAIGSLIQNDTADAAEADQIQSNIFQPSKQIKHILYGIYRQTRWDNVDADAAEVEEYRRSLYRIYVNIIRKRAFDVLSFLMELADQLPAQFSQMDPNDLESFIFMIYRFREGVGVASDIQALEERNGTFMGIILRIHAGILGEASLGITYHPSVLMTYYDFAVRYTRCLHHQPELIPSLLSMMFGLNGLENQHGHVRSRVCYMFIRLVRSIGNLIIPHISTILQALYPRLVVATNPEVSAIKTSDSTFLTYDDRLYLFELAGHVIAGLHYNSDATSDLNVLQVKYQYTKTILEPLFMALSDATQLAERGGSRSDMEDVAAYISRLLNAIAYFLKAFKGKECISEQEQILKQVLLAINKVLEIPIINQQTMVRSKVIFLLHRLVSILDGKQFLAHASETLKRLMLHCESQEVVEIVQLLNQLIIKFKKEFKSFMELYAIQFMQHLWSVMPTEDAIVTRTDNGSVVKNSHQLEREQTLKYLYLFMLHLVLHELDDIFLSCSNRSHLEAIFTIVLEGCSYTTDLQINRTCYTIAHQVGSRWLGLSECSSDSFPAEVKAWYSQWLAEKFTPSVFSFAQKEHFNPEDAQSMLVVKEMALLLQCGVQALGNEFVLFLRNHILPSMNITPEQADAFCTQLSMERTNKVMLLKDVFVHLKRQQESS